MKNLLLFVFLMCLASCTNGDPASDELAPPEFSSPAEVLSYSDISTLSELSYETTHPFVLVAEEGSSEDYSKLLELGADPYLQKSVCVRIGGALSDRAMFTPSSNPQSAEFDRLFREHFFSDRYINGNDGGFIHELVLWRARGGLTLIYSNLFSEALEIKLASSDVKRKDEGGMSALMHAASLGELESVRQLVEFDSSLAAQESVPKGWTPLFYAASRNKEEVVDYLLGLQNAFPEGAGAEIERSVVFVARQLGEGEVRDRFLESANAKYSFSLTVDDLDIPEGMMRP